MKLSLVCIALIASQAIAIHISRTEYVNRDFDAQYNLANLDINAAAIKQHKRRFSNSWSDSRDYKKKAGKKAEVKAETVVVAKPEPVVVKAEPVVVKAEPVVVKAEPVVVAKSDVELESSIRVFKEKQVELELAEQQSRRWNNVIQEDRAYLNANVDSVINSLAIKGKNISAEYESAMLNASLQTNKSSTTVVEPIVVEKKEAKKEEKKDDKKEVKYNYIAKNDDKPYVVERHGDHNHVIIGDSN